jgi:hypothetical protein
MNAFRLVQVDSNDQPIAANSIGPGVCANGALGRAIGMHRATGDVITACENGNKVKFYQRVSAAGAFIDAAPVAVHELDSSFVWSLYFLVDYNAAGEVAFAADVDYTATNNWVATFLSTQMTPVATTSPYGSGAGNDRILATSTGDFIVPIAESSDDSQRYTATGTLVSNASAGGRFRLDALDRLYVLQGNQVTRSAFPW